VCGWQRRNKVIEDKNWYLEKSRASSVSWLREQMMELISSMDLEVERKAHLEKQDEKGEKRIRLKIKT